MRPLLLPIALAVLLSTLVLSACSHQRPSYAIALEAALQQHPGVPATVDAAAPFIALFSDFAQVGAADAVAAVYAEELYFSDTLTLITRREDLLAYFQRLHTSEARVAVDIASVLVQENDLYVRWRMQTQFRVAGRQRQSDSVGVTLLRFNEQGQVVVQQDFWDSTEGFYRHLPVVGGLLNWIGGQFHAH